MGLTGPRGRTICSASLVRTYSESVMSQFFATISMCSFSSTLTLIVIVVVT